MRGPSPCYQPDGPKSIAPMGERTPGSQVDSGASGVPGAAADPYIR